MPLPPSINYFRRHSQGCEAGRAKDQYSTEAEERRRGFVKCHCRIYARGTLGGRFKNFPTREREWDRAHLVMAPFLAAGSWDISPNEPPPSPPAPAPKNAPGSEPSSGHAIKDEVEACIDRRKKLKYASSTLRSYTTVLKQFVEFADKFGLRYVEEWKREHTRILHTHWITSEAEGGRENQPLSSEKKLGYLKAFFRPFVDDDILPKNPAKIEMPQNLAYREARKPRQKSPLSDGELERLLDACRTLDKVQTRRGTSRGNVVHIGKRDHRYKCTGQDYADFLQLSWRTGLRIVDVTMFHIERLQADGTLKVRPMKNGNWVCVWIPEFLQAMIRRRAAIHGPYIFGPHGSEKAEVNAKKWRDRLARFSSQCGIRLTHHRFRHTFVRILLQDNVPVSLIADLIGDTEETVRKHYSDWVPERQENANRQLQKAFVNNPRLHAV